MKWVFGRVSSVALLLLAHATLAGFFSPLQVRHGRIGGLLVIFGMEDGIGVNVTNPGDLEGIFLSSSEISVTD